MLTLESLMYGTPAHHVQGAPSGGSVITPAGANGTVL